MTKVSFTAVYRRADGDAAALCVEGELVHVHLTGADHSHVLFIRDQPIVVHIDVRAGMGVVLLHPEANAHKILSGCVCAALNQTAVHETREVNQQGSCFLAAHPNNSVKPVVCA